jgi:preprotein translocase subunit SecA
VSQIEQREGMKAEGQVVKQLGGLHIIGTERHEARRIDLQLRGRCGRQGDPGTSRFYLSLEDDLMRIFAGEWVKNVLTRLGMQEGEAIESRMVSRRIEGAQKKVEERNFEIRKNLLEYDEVMDEQRKRVYGYRQKILDGASCRELIEQMIREQIESHLTTYLSPTYGAESFAAEAGRRLGAPLEAGDFLNVDFSTAERLARDEAERTAETQVYDAIEENLPDDEEGDTSEWNWDALAKLLHARWNLNLRDRDLKKIDRSDLAEFLIEKAHAAIQEIDLTDAQRCLAPDFGLLTVCEWLHTQFGVEIDPKGLREAEPAEVIRLAREKVEETYNVREVEYPVVAGLYHFSYHDAHGHPHIDREQFVAWARDRFGVDIDLDELKNKQRGEIRSLLVEHSRAQYEKSRQALAGSQEWIDRVFGAAESRGLTAAEATGGNGILSSLADWLKQTAGSHLSVDELGRFDRERLAQQLTWAIEDRFRPEMRRLERILVLQTLDSAWKDHLLAMDHLRSSVGLRGYAQVDPKVEYKREGMRLFEEMWKSIGAMVTRLVFRMEQLDERFVGSTWADAEAIHAEAPSASTIAAQQQAAISGTEADQKLEPIRNRGQRVGRNDPCPCGSGKKYKRCCIGK